MQENSIEPKELPAWEEIRTEQLPAVELFDGKEHILTFMVNKPFETTGHKFKGKRTFLFDVKEEGQPKTLIVTSIRLAVKLKALKQLKDRRIAIKRQGKNTDINYDVRDLDNVPVEEVK